MYMGEFILAFRSTEDAIMAERKLLDSGVDVRVMPTPKAIGPACGMCLRINREEMQRARMMLGKTVKAIFCRDDGGAGFTVWNPEFKPNP
jgi:hypothetical protein